MKLYKIFILLIPAIVSAQEFEFVLETDSIPMIMDNWQPFCSWVGGYGESHPDFCDINADTDLDLFIGHNRHYIDYYENVGSSTLPDYILFSYNWDSVCCFPNNSRSNPDFWDLDNDGDIDLLIGAGYVRYYRNEGTINQPDFTGFSDTLFDNSGNWVFGTHVALVDIDYDGDGDLICGEYQGHLQFYRNVGTIDSFSFYLEDNQWLNINVNDNADPCFIDIDFDNDYDLFIGNREGRIWYYHNEGDSLNYNFVYITNNFAGIDVGDFASPEFADIDGDGDYDLFVGREANNNSLMGDIFFYENIGAPTNPQFNFITKNYLTLDLGYTRNLPNFVDIDGDSDMDLIVGLNIGLSYFRNIGDSVNPNFVYVDSGFQSEPINEVFPFFVDIDADGDYDMICGESVIPGPPVIKLYINRGTSQNPDIVLHDPQFITNPDFFVNAHPVCADIDSDGDYDLFINDNDGHFFFYINDGTPQLPNFISISPQWQGIQFPYPYEGWRGFHFADLDDDGDLDMLMQNIWQLNTSNVRFYRNTGTPQSPNMVIESEEFLSGYKIMGAVPFIVDIDSDSDLDIFCGELNGGIMFFRNLDSQPVVRRPGKRFLTFSLQQNYPNPFNAVTTIPLTLERALPVRVVVYNQLGQRVETLFEGKMSKGTHRIRWDGARYGSGVYFISLGDESGSQEARKVLLVK